MMRSLIYFTAGLVVLFSSCDSSKDPSEVDSWILDSIYAAMTMTEQSADQLDYTERVEFLSDGSFRKSQERDGETTVLEGRWTITEQGSRSGYLVMYPADHPFIRNCTIEPVEFFFISRGILIQNDFMPCDGPEYRYIPATD